MSFSRILLASERPNPIRIATQTFCCLVVIFASLLLSPLSSAQDVTRRMLEHEDYDLWNTMSASSISRDGNWIVYLVQNGAIDGEATLHIHSTKTGKEYVIDRGSSPQISFDSRHVAYRISPSKKIIKKLRKDKAKESDYPKTLLQILELETGDTTTIEDVRSFAMPKKNGRWLACLLNEADEQDRDSLQPELRETYEVTSEGLRRPSKPLKLKSRQEPEPPLSNAPEQNVKKPEPSSETKNPAPPKKDRSPGSTLVLVDLKTGVQRSYPWITSYAFSEQASHLAMTLSTEAGEEETEPQDGVQVIQLNNMSHRTVLEGTGEYKSLAFHKGGEHLAFLSNRDDYPAETPSWTLYHWTAGSKQAQEVAKEGSPGIPAGWWVSPNSSQTFSDDAQRLYFEAAPIPEEILEERADAAGDEDQEASDEEKAKLDIWHWQDPQLQPQQLLQVELERRRDYRMAYVLKSKKIVPLATPQIPDIRIDYRSTSLLAVANTNMPYRKTLSWDIPGFQDVYLIHLSTGRQDLVLQKVKWRASLSPEGKYLTWFDAEQMKWFSISTKDPDAEPVEISRGIPHPLQDELHDEPSLPRAYGTAGWLVQDRGILVYDRNDIWQLDPTGESEPICLTSLIGRQHDIRFRYRPLDNEQRAIDPNRPLILSAFHRKTKASGYYELTGAPESADAWESPAEPRQLIMLDESLGRLIKAQDNDKVMFTRSTFRDCPDLWFSTTSFKKISRVSDMNPQQEDFSWGTAELVHWKADDGQDLDGILLKPDDFDASKKYPMIVYFYERNSDNLHSYYPPAAGRSIICHSFYVSRGYLVFIPDIPYTTGSPGPSAANSILPGVKHLLAKGFVHEDKIGMQGHSWGGYQTAYLVTQTDMFACAESGAPVSNMTSAYGGIRWGSGMSRMFQYERTQSRIGEDLWSARDKYLANSPLFFADKINTPLLILHNDEDGAVPWYQGIELFVALRRLEKPAWMLNYNGNPHWVMGDYNRRDFAIRMQQFFDHYLKNAPEPEWLALGVPAIDKGENYGLELLEPEAPVEGNDESQ